MGGTSLPRDLLEQQLDSLGIETAKKFETGITDPDGVANTERLSDYPDYGYDDDYDATRRFDATSMPE